MQPLFYSSLIRFTLLLLALVATSGLSAQTDPVRTTLPPKIKTRPQPQIAVDPSLVLINQVPNKRNCCLPTTQERNMESLVLEPTGTLSGDYRLTVNIQQAYADILRAYINYIGSVTPCANRFVTQWILRSPTTNQEDVQWIFVDAGASLLHNNPYTFNIPIQVNMPYSVQIYTYFEPKGCDIDNCVDNSTYINFTLQVSPTARQTAPELVIREGEREISRQTIGRSGKRFSTTVRQF